jgi:uncharacterized SAM-binding protein YcdF (DUF218 family)
MQNGLYQIRFNTMNTQSKPRMGCCLGGTAGAFLAVVLGIAAAFLLLWAAGGFLIYADPLKNADAVVPLSGGSDLSRLEEAARIYNAKYAKTFIITETGEDMPDLGVLRSTVQRDKLLLLGVPANDIMITERHVNSTYEEARVTMKLLRLKGMTSVIVVTEPYHSMRAHVIFRDVYKNTGIKVIIRPAPSTWYRSKTWWLSSEGWQATIYEYAKLIGYYFGVSS